jgi:hypothetical protein
MDDRQAAVGAMLLAEIIALVTAVLFGILIARFGQLNGRAPAEI